jgi:hypothetical protein
MKFRNLVLALIAAVGLMGSAKAQMPAEVKTDVPFAFMVGDTMLPAGKYEITPLDEGQIQIAMTSGSPSVIQTVETTEGVEEAPRTELVFHRYGDREFLSQIRIEGDQDGVALLPSKAEKELMDKGQKAEVHSYCGAHTRAKRIKDRTAS